MLQWFQKASTTVMTNVSIDATKDIQEFEVSYLLSNLSGCHLSSCHEKATCDLHIYYSLRSKVSVAVLNCG